MSLQLGGSDDDLASLGGPGLGRAAGSDQFGARAPNCSCTGSGLSTHPIPIASVPRPGVPGGPGRAAGRPGEPGPTSVPTWQLPDWSRLEGLPDPAPRPLRADYFDVDDFDPDAELTSEALVRRQRLPPTRGWRLAVWAASGGRINPGLGAVESARLELIQRIRRPLPSTHRVAVVSVKGGVGKTTVAACLGSVLAEQRADRVVAVDANPDAGSLSERLTGQGGMTVRDLYEDIPNLRSVVELTRYARLAGRLHVLGSEQEPALGEALGAGEYLEVCELLARFYNVIVTDSGTGLVHAAMEATLATADSLVVVGAPTVDGATKASRTLAFLADNGYRDLAEQALVVLSGHRYSPDVDQSRIRAHFAARCRAVLDIPPDPHLATGGRIDLSRCREQTLDAFHLMAAYVADGFGARSPARPAPAFRPGDAQNDLRAG